MSDEIISINRDTVLAAIVGMEAGLEYARECLSQHDVNLGRTTRQNRTWAETMEDDIRRMECAMDELKRCAEPLK